MGSNRCRRRHRNQAHLPGAYLAAGSVITDPVPADALALGRARQVIKEGWAKARREKKKKTAQQ